MRRSCSERQPRWCVDDQSTPRRQTTPILRNSRRQIRCKNDRSTSPSSAPAPPGSTPWARCARGRQVLRPHQRRRAGHHLRAGGLHALQGDDPGGRGLSPAHPPRQVRHRRPRGDDAWTSPRPWSTCRTCATSSSTGCSAAAPTTCRRGPVPAGLRALHRADPARGGQRRDEQRIRAGAVVIATGSTPLVPAPWRELGDALLTTDSLFELEDLPAPWPSSGLAPSAWSSGRACTGSASR
jgi:hypothetical protein